ncbi:hypothetical protein WAK64_12955 [Bacillus spongiae]|uniref:Uncharacterized protein n=1 Tax=Bacillus spongiae TaxID=2683610 RepID=A0ABU8HF46_9BACI
MDALILFVIATFTMLIVGFFSFLQGLQIIVQKGVSKNSTFALLVGFLLSIMQFTLLADGKDQIYVFLIITAVVVIVYIKKHGKTVRIERTTKNEVLMELRKLLQRNEISYNFKHEPDEKPKIDLLNEKATIKIDYFGDPEKKRAYSVTFRQWWKVPYKKLITQLQEEFESKRMNESYVKEGLIQMAGALFIFAIVFYFLFKFNSLPF